MGSHLLRETDMLDKTVLCCSCGRWLFTSPLRLAESQHDDEMKRLRRDWLQHVRDENA